MGSTFRRPPRRDKRRLVRGKEAARSESVPPRGGAFLGGRQRCRVGAESVPTAGGAEGRCAAPARQRSHGAGLARPEDSVELVHLRGAPARAWQRDSTCLAAEVGAHELGARAHARAHKHSDWLSHKMVIELLRTPRGLISVQRTVHCPGINVSSRLRRTAQPATWLQEAGGWRAGRAHSAWRRLQVSACVPGPRDHGPSRGGSAPTRDGRRDAAAARGAVQQHTRSRPFQTCMLPVGGPSGKT